MALACTEYLENVKPQSGIETGHDDAMPLKYCIVQEIDIAVDGITCWNIETRREHVRTSTRTVCF
jgi:hypothetical protein